ncbi:thymidylate synthase [Methanobrevibacter sp.]|uniref:thymidylate synthase n=1 Tax=Methanobrevibacter sp. TaxID=66852 RepID=UPI0025D2C551|nr:thymidylate synthase [Methanobrevibacter sp.]MBQ2832397.1 hypothetical protein [Methanobrevibacter sp.]
MSLETIWKKLLKEVITKGHEHTKDDSPIREIIGVHEFIPNQFLQTPIYIHPDEFLKGIKKGAYDIKDYPMSGEALHDYVASLNDPAMITGIDTENESSFIYTYPQRLMDYVTVDKVTGEIGEYNQLQTMIERLEENSGSNRAVATLYNVGLDCIEEHIPCLNWIQALIRNNELTLTIIFRSNDCYGAWPSNMLFINHIGLYLVDKLRETYRGLIFKGIYYNCSSLHIYETDMPAAKKVVGL